MKIKSKSLKHYLYRIFTIIFLTELTALLLILLNFKLWLGYFLGSFAAYVNFYFQAKGAEKSLGIGESGARLSVFKNFYLRYFILVAFVIIIVKFLQVNIFALLGGLIAIPVVVALDSLFAYLKEKRES